MGRSQTPRLESCNVRTPRDVFLAPLVASLGSCCCLPYKNVYTKLFTLPSNAVFLTCLASIFIPIINFIFLKQKPQAKVLVSIVLALTGVGLLSFQGKFQLNVGDILCVLCSIAFAVHIIVTEKYTQEVDSVSLGVLQLGFVGLYSLVASFVFEIPTLPTTALSWSVVIVLSIFCTAIAFIVQTVVQKYTDSIHTGLIFTLEPVFGAFFAFLFLSEVLTRLGYLGGVLLIISILLVEVDFKTLMSQRV